jgi:hypothetical protein
MYYRVAIQVGPSADWKWKSTPLGSLHTLFQFLRLNQALPQDCLRVFSAHSREELNQQLERENQSLGSTSVTAAQFLQERLIITPERRPRAVECGTAGMECRASLGVAVDHLLNERIRGTHALEVRGSSVLEQRRQELERGAGGDYDMPYSFILPTSIPQILAWMKLLAKVQHGELQP